MINITNATKSKTLKAQYAIVLFKDKEPFKRSDNFCYATAHRVRSSGKRSAFGEGVPLSRQFCIRALLELLGSTEIPVLPSCVLAVAPNLVAWWCPPGIQPTWFSPQINGPLAGRNAQVHHPGLLFVAVGRDLFVACTRGNQRPEPDDELFEVPHFNVWDSGHVCIGNVDFPTTPQVSKIAIYEKGFFESYWTHPNVTHKVVNYRGGLTQLWLDLLDQKFRRFPERIMIKTDQTVRQFIQRIGGGAYARVR